MNKWNCRGHKDLFCEGMCGIIFGIIILVGGLYILILKGTESVWSYASGIIMGIGLIISFLGFNSVEYAWRFGRK